jgi:hypothetical protein
MLPDLRIWLNHFEYHAQHLRCVPEELPDVLTGRERALIARSLATFQLGEYSTGRRLMSAARRFAHLHDRPELARIMELFVREQRRHADLLREFMTDHGMRVRNHSPTDLAFRGIRRLAGFELYLHVLVAAELIGNIYYRALETVTGCRRLKILCRTLVADELAHIGFESVLLRELHAQRSPLTRAVMRIAHRAFFSGVVLTVWTTHRGILRQVGYDLATFTRVCRAQYSFYLDLPVSTHGRTAQRATPLA